MKRQYESLTTRQHRATAMTVPNHSSNQRISINEAIEQLRRLRSLGGFAIFVGAGISKKAPSNCPIAYELMEKVITSAVRAYPALRKFGLLEHRSIGQIKPEDFYQILFSNLETHFFPMLDILFLGHPNVNHMAIASLSAQTTCPLIITTNFDVLIEDAFAVRKIPLEVYRHNVPRKFYRTLRRNHDVTTSRNSLIKIHGSLDERSSIIITLRQSRLRLPSRISSLLQSIFTSSPVLVVGYSGKDDDIFSVLIDIATEAKMVFWTLWDEKEKDLNPFIQQFVARCPNCRLVVTNGRDLLPELVENRDLLIPKVNLSPSSLSNTAEHFLSKWGSMIPFEVWLTFFAEMVLFLDKTKEAANMVISALSNVPNKHASTYHEAIMHKNIGTALFRVGNKSKAVEEFLRAIHYFRRMKRNRETIECAAQVIQGADSGIQFSDEGFASERTYEDLASLALKLSDREYGFYELGLANLASGISFLREGEIEQARVRLSLVVAYSMRSGDKDTLSIALGYLSEIYQKQNNKDLANQSAELASKVRQTIGHVHRHVVGHSNEPIMRIFEKSYKKEMKSIIASNLLWFLIIPGIISALLAHFLSPYAWLFAVSAAGTRVQILIKKYKKTRIYRV